MTTTNFNNIPELQELSDQDLEQVTGGFRFLRWIKGLFGFGKKKVFKDQNYWNNYHKKAKSNHTHV